MRANIVSLAISMAVAVSAASADAQTPQQIKWCEGKDNATPDLTISGCTALIQSGKFDASKLAIVFLLRGKAYGEKENSDEAIADLTQAIELNPNFARAYAERGGEYIWHRENYEAALRDLAKAINLEPGLATAWAYRGDALYKAGRDQEAIASFERAIKLAPSWMWPINDRGELHAENGNYEEAIQDFDRVVQLSPTLAMGWNNRCRVLAIVGRLEKALSDCDQAMKIDPNFTNSMFKTGHVSARQHRAFVLLKLGRYDESIQEYTQALELLSNAETLFGRGVAKLKKGDEPAANVDIDAARAVDPLIDVRFAGFGVKLR